MNLIVALLVSSISAQRFSLPRNSCTTDRDVGNPVNFLHIFQESNAHLWDFNNFKTDFAFLGQFITPHSDRVHQTNSYAFLVKDSEILPPVNYLFLVEALFTSGSGSSPLTLKRINKLGRFAVGAHSEVVQIASNFFGSVVEGLEDFLTNVTTFDNSARPQGAREVNKGCSPLTKLEFAYFYYMFTNYYKDGSLPKAPTVS